jgi:hypothetical protein
MFPVVKQYTGKTYSDLKSALSTPIIKTYFLDNGSIHVIKPDNSTFTLANPLVSTSVVENSTNQLISESIIPRGRQSSADKIFLSNNRKWILYDAPNSSNVPTYWLLWNTVHSSEFAKFIEKTEEDSTTFSNIQNLIINPYCKVIGNRDPLCICNRGDTSVCTTDLLGSSTALSSFSQEAQDTISNGCRCLSASCKGSSLNTVTKYMERLSKDNISKCADSITISICNANITAKNSVELNDKITQNCNATTGTGGTGTTSNTGTGTGGTGSGSSGSSGSRPPPTPPPSPPEPESGQSFFTQHKTLIIVSAVVLVLLCMMSLVLIAVV